MNIIWKIKIKRKSKLAIKKAVIIVSVFVSFLGSYVQAQEIEFDLMDFYNSDVAEYFYSRLNSGQLLPDDYQTLEYLKQYANDTIIIHKTFTDKNGNNNLEIKVINPCRLSENIEEMRVDGKGINFIFVQLENENYSDTLIYYNPDPQMSLINLVENNIVLKSISGKQAVFILFAYCGNADDDEQITCIVFYYHKKYIYRINLHGVEFQNYKIVDDLNEKLKDLPKKLKKELINHINSQYETVLGFEN